MRKRLACVVSVLWLVGCTAAVMTGAAPSPMAGAVVPQSTKPPAGEVESTATQAQPALPTVSVTAKPSGVTMTPTPINDPVLNAQLIQAAEVGDTSAVQQLLAQGANINTQD